MAQELWTQEDIDRAKREGNALWRKLHHLDEPDPHKRALLVVEPQLRGLLPPGNVEILVELVEIHFRDLMGVTD